MSEIRSQATPARDELAAALKGGVLGLDYRNGAIYLKHEDDNRDYLTLGPPLWAWDIYAALVNLANEKPRTVNSAAELDALPAGTVLRNNKSGRVFEKTRDKGAGKLKWMRMQDRWVYETYEILNESTWTVLFTPGDAG